MSDNFFEELQDEFLVEAKFLLDQYEESMLELEGSPQASEAMTKIFRVAHSIKGGAAAVGFQDLASFAHVVEDLLDLLRNQPHLSSSESISLLLRSGDELKKRIIQLEQKSNETWNLGGLKEELVTQIFSLGGTVKENRAKEEPTIEELLAADAAATAAASGSAGGPQVPPPVPAVPVMATQSSGQIFQKSAAIPVGRKPASSGSVKVDNSRIDSVLDAVGELVVLKNQLLHDEVIRTSNSPRLELVVGQIDKSIRELYEKTLSIRMTPLKSLFVKVQRLVRDVSITLGKNVNLIMTGEETEIDRTVSELLNDPMVHIVRNALDHGIEEPETREAAGKPKVATLRISAKQVGQNVVIEVADDGAGINKEKVLKKAIEKGLYSADVDFNKIPDGDVYNLLFAPGFSTADKISDLSGRGVGLDVVRSNIERINGKITIDSTRGQGSTFTFTIPLTTAITDGIDVVIKSYRFILPIHSIREIVRVEDKDFTSLPGKGEVVKIRDHLISVLDTTSLLGRLSSAMQKQSENQVGDGNIRHDKRMGDLYAILESGRGSYALNIDDVNGQAQVVVKAMNVGAPIPEIAGAAVMGNGQTVLILDPTALTLESAKAVENVA